MKSNKVFILAALGCAVVAAAALAQQKVAGEKWRMKMSMQAEGFTMPARTTEMCLPVGNTQEAMLKQGQDNGNCSVSNYKQSGNKFSADMKCTGKDAMEGHVEMEQLGPNSTRGSMTAKTADGSMKMDYEYTKVGQACEATDYSNYKPPVAAAQPQIDFCQRAIEQVGSENLYGQAIAMVTKYPTPDGSGVQDCTTHTGFQKFCSAVQTPAGYASLDYEQWNQGRLNIKLDSDDPSVRMRSRPLTESLKACKLDSSDAGIVKLQKQVAAAARKDGQWGFVLYYDAADRYSELQGLAKKECSGRSFTNAADKQYLGLCSRYGAMLARDDRSGVLEAAGCSQEREDKARGICVGATSGSSGAMAAVGGAGGSGGASGSASAPANPEEEAKASAKDKAKEAVDKGKKALRGIFGGG
ncbi:MAG TPA: DUF3617 family protein [Steroidobacteraceae bacterium]|nr:DUF3617 family protein [Steroidobacteraceae bacterium]